MTDATVATSEIKGLSFNALVMNSLITSVEGCLQMCDLKMRVVGVTKIPIQLPNAPVTGMIGLNGKCTGFLSLSMPERVATLAVSGLSMEEHKTVNAQVIDGVGEITNIIAGGLKTKLFNTPWMVSSITVPSVILGSSYHISYSKGIEYCGITFEVDDPDTLIIQERVFMVNTSLIQATS
jgi:chemotaxis protein CheX